MAAGCARARTARAALRCRRHLRGSGAASVPRLAAPRAVLRLRHVGGGTSRGWPRRTRRARTTNWRRTRSRSSRGACERLLARFGMSESTLRLGARASRRPPDIRALVRRWLFRKGKRQPQGAVPSRYEPGFRTFGMPTEAKTARRLEISGWPWAKPHYPLRCSHLRDVKSLQNCQALTCAHRSWSIDIDTVRAYT